MDNDSSTRPLPKCCASFGQRVRSRNRTAATAGVQPGIAESTASSFTCLTETMCLSPTMIEKQVAMLSKTSPSTPSTVTCACSSTKRVSRLRPRISLKDYDDLLAR